jgi:superfamily II DNA or RNA helicase
MPGGRPLRAWQAKALARYLARGPQDFLAVATPGAGKTTFALAVARSLLAEGIVRGITVVTPTEHLKAQWATAAGEAGVQLDPTYRNADGAIGTRGFHGAVLTYAQVAAAPELHRIRTTGQPTLVILDEVHHAGDALSWGDAVRNAFQPATRRLALTGTPFRSDTTPIPFVSYAPDDDGVRRSVADTSYGYAEALREGVVRPVLFLAYSGETSWRTSAGDIVNATLGEPLTADVTSRAWRTALDPGGDWIPTVLAAADRRLTEMRRGMPDAAGLVIASDQTAARAYAAILRDVTGHRPTVTLSDDDDASKRLAEFDRSGDRWLVAVRMVSEGVDIPRLAVGVYATSASTPLYFAQAVGRFVRSRRPGESASVFLPSVPSLLALAGQMELQRDHALDRIKAPDDIFGEEDALIARANSQQDTPDAPLTYEALGATAHLDRLVIDGAEHGIEALPGSPEEEDYLGLPGRPASRPGSSGPSCARSSTAWWPPGTCAPTPRTARSTPSSAVSAVDPRWPRPASTSCRTGSTSCAPGPPSAGSATAQCFASSRSSSWSCPTSSSAVSGSTAAAAAWAPPLVRVLKLRLLLPVRTAEKFCSSWAGVRPCSAAPICAARGPATAGSVRSGASRAVASARGRVETGMVKLVRSSRTPVPRCQVTRGSRPDGRTVSVFCDAGRCIVTTRVSVS